jgi:hypothetical protein
MTEAPTKGLPLRASVTFPETLVVFTWAKQAIDKKLSTIRRVPFTTCSLIGAKLEGNSYVNVTPMLPDCNFNVTGMLTTHSHRRESLVEQQLLI